MKIRGAALALSLLLAGCGFFRPQQKEYFSLETIEPEAAAVAAVGGLPVGVGSFVLPPSIDRREIVVREAAEGEIDLRGRELWGAPLETMVIHTLAFDLAARLPEGMVVLPGQAKPVGAMRSVDVIAETFQAGPDPVLVLHVRWRVAAPGAAPGVAHHETIPISMESLESAEIASAMSRALAALADRIVQELE